MKSLIFKIALLLLASTSAMANRLNPIRIEVSHHFYSPDTFLSVKAVKVTSINGSMNIRVLNETILNPTVPNWAVPSSNELSPAARNTIFYYRGDTFYSSFKTPNAYIIEVVDHAGHTRYHTFSSHHAPIKLKYALVESDSMFILNSQSSRDIPSRYISLVNHDKELSINPAAFGVY